MDKVYYVNRAILVLVPGLTVRYKGKPHITQVQIYHRATFII